MLAQHEASKENWDRFETHLHDRAMTLREVLAAEAALITCTLEQADAFLAAETHFDPSFRAFVEQCHSRNVPISIVSSGIAPLIERALMRNEIVGVDVRANEIEALPTGWVMHFRDDSDNGHDKAADVRAAKMRGSTVVYVGDGFSDFEAAVFADVRFAKTGRSLVGYLRKQNLPFHEFSSFTEVAKELY